MPSDQDEQLANLIPGQLWPRCRNANGQRVTIGNSKSAQKCILEFDLWDQTLKDALLALRDECAGVTVRKIRDWFKEVVEERQKNPGANDRFAVEATWEDVWSVIAKLHQGSEDGGLVVGAQDEDLMIVDQVPVISASALAAMAESLQHDPQHQQDLIRCSPDFSGPHNISWSITPLYRYNLLVERKVAFWSRNHIQLGYVPRMPDRPRTSVFEHISTLAKHNVNVNTALYRRSNAEPGRRKPMNGTYFKTRSVAGTKRKAPDHWVDPLLGNSCGGEKRQKIHYIIDSRDYEDVIPIPSQMRDARQDPKPSPHDLIFPTAPLARYFLGLSRPSPRDRRWQLIKEEGRLRYLGAVEDVGMAKESGKFECDD